MTEVYHTVSNSDERIIVGLEASDTDRNGENWSDSGYILKADQCNYWWIESKEFPYRIPYNGGIGKM